MQLLNRGELNCSETEQRRTEKFLLRSSLSVQSLHPPPSICDILKYTQDTTFICLYVCLFVCFLVCLLDEQAHRVDEQVGQKQGNPINAARQSSALKRVHMYVYTRVRKLRVCVYICV